MFYGLSTQTHCVRQPVEASIRVPLIIVPPGGMRPKDVSATVLNIDWAPTFLSAVGLPAPESMEGRSLLPLIVGGNGVTSPWRQDFLYEHFLAKLYNYSAEKENFLPSSEGIRNERYTYLRYPRQPGANEMLFDRQADPDELRNITKICDPQLLLSMRKRTDELIAAMG